MSFIAVLNSKRTQRSLLIIIQSLYIFFWQSYHRNQVLCVTGLQLKKSSRRFLRDKPSGSKEGEDHLSITDGPNKVEKIGDATPVQDFEAMISRRDSPKWVGKAIKDMKNKIHDLVEDSYEGDNYSKALECLIALRKGCILEQVCPFLSHTKWSSSYLCYHDFPLNLFLAEKDFPLPLKENSTWLHLFIPVLLTITSHRLRHVYFWVEW